MHSAFMTQPVWLEQGRKRPSAEMGVREGDGTQSYGAFSLGKEAGTDPTEKSQLSTCHRT